MVATLRSFDQFKAQDPVGQLLLLGQARCGKDHEFLLGAVAEFTALSALCRPPRDAGEKAFVDRDIVTICQWIRMIGESAHTHQPGQFARHA